MNKEWAVFKNDKQISKSYPHKLQAVIDAFERKLAVIHYGSGKVWIHGAKIREV